MVSPKDQTAPDGTHYKEAIEYAKMTIKVGQKRKVATGGHLSGSYLMKKYTSGLIACGPSKNEVLDQGGYLTLRELKNKERK